MKIELAQRMKDISPSLTLAITAKAKELKAQGRDLVSFGAGEPDFDTPEHIKMAAVKAMQAGQTKYTAVGGSPAMKKAIVKKFERDNQLSYTAKEVSCANGGKHVLYNLFMSLLNPGDEVLIPAPYWVSYPDQVKMAQAQPVEIFCGIEDHYLLRPEKLKAAISPRTRLLILNSPSNPTGAAYTKEALLALWEVLKTRQDILIVSDDIYEHILYDSLPFYNLPMLVPEAKERCFIVNGLSKAYSMTGWRIGYCAGNASVISAMEKIQGQCTSNPSSISQGAAIAALEESQDCVGEMRAAFAKRRDLICEKLSALPGIKSFIPQGAFYVFPDISELAQGEPFQRLIKQSPSESLSQVFCRHLLEQYDVAAVPGIAFGYDKAFRISYALGEEQLKKGLGRIAEALYSLH